MFERWMLRHGSKPAAAARRIACWAGCPQLLLLLLLPQIEKGGRTTDAHPDSSADGEVPAPQSQGRHLVGRVGASGGWQAAAAGRWPAAGVL